MNTIINNLIEIIEKNNYEIISISEVNHFSYSSHTFHFNLLKKLISKNLINVVSSEVLCKTDALLINMWLKGKLPNVSLNKLYSNYLPFGGLGTKRWVKYFNKNNIKIKIIGTESDYLESIKFTKPNFLNNIKKILSFKFGNSLTYENINNLIDFKKLKINIETRLDNKIYKNFLNGLLCRNEIKGRYIFWYKQIDKILSQKKKLFINGYHLNKEMGMPGTLLNKNYNMLNLGMASAHKILPLVKIDNFKNVNDINTQYYNSNYTLKFIITDSYKYYIPTNFEKKYNNKFALVKISKLNKNDYIVQMGVNKLAITKLSKKIEMEKLKLSKNHLFKTSVKGYNYIIFIPVSTFNWKMQE